MKTDTLLRTCFKTQLPDRLIIRVDSGAKEGLSFGHLSRCITLANRLKHMNKTIILFIMANYPEGVEFARQNGMDVKTIPIDTPPKETENFWYKEIKRFKPDWTFIDLPYPGDYDPICSKIKQFGSKVLFIDDTRFINVNADIILNTSVLAPKKMRIRQTDTRYYLGPDFFFFDSPDFIPQKKDKLQVIVSFGGSDPAELSRRVIHVITNTQFSQPFDLSLVLGPGYKKLHPAAVQTFKTNEKINIIDSPKNIYPYFMVSDLAICAGGRTLYELNELGTPALAIASIHHEKEVVKQFLKNRIISEGLVNWNEKKFICAFARDLKRISKDRQQL
ncbi:hypothetical protein [Desulfobacter latus]|nr:hypothetical protein [Desulfobacter latus]